MVIRCLNCEQEFAADRKGRKFCSRSCANSHNNKKHPKRKRRVLGRKICDICGKEYRPNRKSQKFCSLDCANKRYSKEAYKKSHTRSVGIAYKRKTGGRKISSIYDVSSRTKSKILNRIGLPCSICGWNKAACDVHHIVPRREGGSDSHENLVLVCPNCHREIESGLVDTSSLITLDKYFPKNWRDLYYN